MLVISLHHKEILDVLIAHLLGPGLGSQTLNAIFNVKGTVRHFESRFILEWELKDSHVLIVVLLVPVSVEDTLEETEVEPWLQAVEGGLVSLKRLEYSHVPLLDHVDTWII